jgi:hypothetical protein
MNREERVRHGWHALRLRAALHELRCRECRVTWRSWLQRLLGDPRGMTP